MLLACLATLSTYHLTWGWIVAGLLLGTGAGVWLAQTTPMTGMPQMVALLNGFGGGASFLVSGVELALRKNDVGNLELIAASLAGLIGAVTLTGSLVAYAKLEEYDWLDDLKVPQPVIVTLVLLLLCVLMIVLQFLLSAILLPYWLLVFCALALGVSLVIRIGGADMPVVISLLNSYSGLAAAGTGFVLSNNVLIISGALVGASGLILTKVMCDGMNRSLTNVLFGGLGTSSEAGGASSQYQHVKATSPEEVAMMLEVAQRVVIIPGYGMAVAQAQHAVSDLCKTLRERNIEVLFGIHPVAGRMPGHMNVLLAEANIPYEVMKDHEEINHLLDQTDVALVLGANDVVNPSALSDPRSPIAGMPIIEAGKARTVVIIKRSLNPGFANIYNPLFEAENALMLFADGRQAVQEINKALKAG